MHEITLSLSYQRPSEAAIIEGSLSREAGDIEGDRTSATVSRAGSEVTITIRSEDLVALRAGHNTWLGLTEVAERTIAAGSR